MQITLECSDGQLRELINAVRSGEKLQAESNSEPKIKLVMNVSGLPRSRSRGRALQWCISALVAVIISFLVVQGSGSSELAAGAVIAIFLTLLFYPMLHVLKGAAGLSWTAFLGLSAILLRTEITKRVSDGILHIKGVDWLVLAVLYLSMIAVERVPRSGRRG